MFDTPQESTASSSDNAGAGEASPTKNTDNGAAPSSRREQSIGHVVYRFVKDIDSLADTLPLAMQAIKGAQATATQSLDDYEREYCKIEEQHNRRVVKIASDKWPRYKRLMERAAQQGRSAQFVPRSFVVSLVSQYDAFLGALIRKLFYLKPESLNVSDRTLTFAELMNFGSVEIAREYLIEETIDTVLRESHSKQFDWLETKFGLPLRKGLEIWPTFIDLNKLRNLFVHTSGVVSRQYLDVCTKHKAKMPQDIAPGKQLGVSTAYFKTVHEVILEIGVKLAHVLWRKVSPDDREVADRSLISITFDLLTEERYAIARTLLDFAVEVIKNHASDQNHRIFIINRAQAYKWSGDHEKARQIVMEQDWSASNDSFRLASAVLLDNFKEAATLVRRIGPTNNLLPEGAYRDWPLFREFRSAPEFLEAFESVFGKPFTTAIEAVTSMESKSDE